MNRTGIVLLAMMVAQTAFPQYQENLPKAKPIPPNAAALFKVLERPLGTYTGTIPISFPLCSVRSGSLTADVALNYNSTGGIRVEELSGCVGLGFSLADGGGRITQQVRDKPDDDPYNGRLVSSIKPSNFICTDETHWWELQERRIDLEPDIFLYSIPGHSGRFFLKENGDVVMMTNDPVKIDRNINPWVFVITDDYGNRFCFGTGAENSSTYLASGGKVEEQYTSKLYYVDRIEDMNNENSITFSYTLNQHLFTTLSGAFRPVTLSGIPTSACSGFNTTGDASVVTTNASEYLVTRIDASNGSILFNYVVDIASGPKKLTSISLFDSNSNFIQKFAFNYGTNFSSNRWKLTSFSEFGLSATDSLTHKFEYNTSINLPDVLSGSVDIWGYYNGAANNNTGLIPNIIYPWGTSSIYWGSSAYRHASEAGSQANILKKIHYPSGGYREFIYEGNKVLGHGNFFLYHPDLTYLQSRTFTETGFTNNGPAEPSLQKLFTVSSYYNGVSFSYALSGLSACGSNYSVRIMKLTAPTDLTGGVLVQTFNAASGNRILQNGYYRIDIYVGNNNFSCTMNGIAGSWSEATTETATIGNPYGPSINYSRRLYNAGGARIKEIRDFDPITGKTNKTEYRYKMYSVDSTVTSGRLAAPVDIITVQNNSTCGCQYRKVAPGSSYPLATENGSYVVYPEVRTIDSANGWTDRIYSFTPDPSPSSFPMEPPMDYSYYRNRLIQEKKYDRNGQLRQKRHNTWTWNTPAYQPGKRIKGYWVKGFDGWTEFPPFDEPGNHVKPGMTDCTTYQTGQPVVALIQSIDSLFETGGVQVSKTDYQQEMYDGVYFVKSKTKTINGGQRKEQTYKYAFTANATFRLGLTATEQSMKISLLAKHYLQPLEVVDSLRPASGPMSFLQGAKYIFGAFNSRIHLAQYRSYTTATDSGEINYSAYDGRGNLTEQYRTNDVKEVYLWGYRGLFPVAKVIGSDYATVSQIVNLSILNAPSSDAVLRTELDKIRAALAGSKAQVFTYTYSPRYGMTSATDASGKTIYYQYDHFGRLRLIRDQDNRILKKYEYRMQNPLF